MLMMKIDNKTFSLARLLSFIPDNPDPFRGIEKAYPSREGRETYRTACNIGSQYMQLAMVDTYDKNFSGGKMLVVPTQEIIRGWYYSQRVFEIRIT